MSQYVGGANTSQPYSGVCYIIATFPDGTMNAATGFVVGPNDVLTASHVIHNTDYGGLAETITVYPGHDGGTSPFGAFTAARVEYLIADADGNGLLTKAESGNDFALLGLDSRVGDSTGLFSLDPGGNASVLEFTGYPSTYRVDNEARLVTDTGSAVPDTLNDVYTYVGIESQPGSSGSPLWYTAADGTARAVGVGSTGDWAAGVAAQHDRITQWIAGNDDLIGDASAESDSGAGTGSGSSGTSVAPGTSDVGAAFDAAWYLSHNADVARAGVDALAHYLSYGWREGRDPNAWFDSDGYLVVYADVAGAGVDPLTHYQLYGWIEGRDPSARFDTSAYLTANPDVAGYPDGALAHYLQFGAGEGRSVFASDDAAWQGVA